MAEAELPRAKIDGAKQILQGLMRVKDITLEEAEEQATSQHGNDIAFAVAKEELKQQAIHE